jgi:hypothetical protein
MAGKWSVELKIPKENMTKSIDDCKKVYREMQEYFIISTAQPNVLWL